MEQDQEVPKPFWGPHRILQTLSLIRSILTTSVVSIVIWVAGENVWSYDQVNSQVAAAFVLPFNTLYYFYQHADMTFGYKIALQVTNALYSLWLMVVIFANLPRLAVPMCHDVYSVKFGCVIGVIYMSYAFCYQLEQLLNGLVSLTISCAAVITRKPPQQSQLNTEQLNAMKSRLQMLQQCRDNQV